MRNIFILFAIIVGIYTNAAYSSAKSPPYKTIEEEISYQFKRLDILSEENTTMHHSELMSEASYTHVRKLVKWNKDRLKELNYYKHGASTFSKEAEPKLRLKFDERKESIDEAFFTTKYYILSDCYNELQQMHSKLGPKNIKFKEEFIMGKRLLGEMCDLLIGLKSNDPASRTLLMEKKGEFQKLLTGYYKYKVSYIDKLMDKLG